MPKKKKSKKGKTKEYLPLVYSIPAYEDPEESVPKITIKVQLLNPSIKELAFQKVVPINIRLEQLRKEVVALHKGAIKDICFYKDRSDIPEILDMSTTLEDSGVELAAEINLYYDFKPYMDPLLGQK